MEGEVIARIPGAGASTGDMQDLVLGCNRDGMDSLRKGNMKGAFEQLKYAEAILIANQQDENSSLLAVTCNNLGCYYKRTGKLHAALSYLRRALKIEVSLQTDNVTVSGTHLNLCSILSMLEKHDKALQHALCALELVAGHIYASEEFRDGVGEALPPVTQDDYTTLAIAYHNVAVEREYLQQWDQAAMAYKRGFEIARRSLGEDHSLTETLCRNIQAVLSKTNKLPTVKALKPQGAAPQPPLGSKPSTPRRPARSSRDVTTPRDVLPELRTPRTPGDKREESKRWDSFVKDTLAGTRPSGQGFRLAPAGSEPGPDEPPAGAKADDSSGAPPESDQTPDCKPRKSRKPTTTMPWDHIPPVVHPMVKKFGLPPPPAILQALEEAAEETAEGDTRKHSGRPNPLGPLLSARGADLAATGPSLRNGLPATPGVGARGQLGATLQAQQSVNPDAEVALINFDDPSVDDRRKRRNPIGFAPNDYRPNRIIRNNAKRTTQALTDAGFFNSTHHRDQVVSKRKKPERAARPRQSKAVEEVAAERIQRTYRAYKAYCMHNRDWIQAMAVCAVKIQAVWRAHYSRKADLHVAATLVQKIARGFILRTTLRRNRAASTISKFMVGYLCRKELRRVTVACIHCQRLVRGHLGRLVATNKRAYLTMVCCIIQKTWRKFSERRRQTFEEREQARSVAIMKCALNVQRYFRGIQGRQRFQIFDDERQAQRRRVRAAVVLQSFARGEAAKKLVQTVREARLAKLHNAATFIRKQYLRHRYHFMFMRMIKDYKSKSVYAVVIQRHVRGLLARRWIENQRSSAAESIWAATEIQRIWRGNLGRLYADAFFEQVWSRELAAARMQRNIRGWLVRCRIRVVRRRIARVEFDRAKARYVAAQKIQAWLRGTLVRHVLDNRRRLVNNSVYQIQKCWRGYFLRCKLWLKVLNKRATSIQKIIRGFLVRRRKVALTQKVSLIQRSYRRFHRLPKEERQWRLEQMRTRRRAVTTIRTRWEDFKRFKQGRPDLPPMTDDELAVATAQLVESAAVLEHAGLLADNDWDSPRSADPTAAK
mmetsp:Transcript_66492/g.152320  ORF Transcript_66492/g.152320 Transcript_66492/m.152320 type:complete len:1053 (-) Transcript_66492:162-3320(-)